MGSNSNLPHPVPTDTASSPDGQVRQADGPANTTFDPVAAEAPPPTSHDPGPDPFDPASLRITSDFDATVGVKRAILGIQARKPDKTWWVRAHPGQDYRLQTAVIELRGERGAGETYLVAPHLRDDLAAEPTFRP